MLIIKHYLVTGVAQRKRARLITLRTPDRNGSPVFFPFVRFIRIEPSMLVTLPKHTFTPLSSSAERQAHNLEVTGTTPVGGILSFRSFIERTLNPPSFSWRCIRSYLSSWTLNVAKLLSLTRRCSSAEERLTPSPSFSTLSNGGPIWGWLSAHNREVVGSKPTIGIHLIHHFTYPL